MSNMQIVQSIDNLVKIDDDVHWFCPRSNADDHEVYFDEDCLQDQQTEKETAERHRRVQELEPRLDEIALACKILAFDGADAAAYWEKLEVKLKLQLTRCDICVRQFHRFRAHLKSTLEAEHDEEEVKEFMCKYDEWNMSRIGTALDKATEHLLGLESQARSINALDPAGMYAMFEALNCIPFLLDEEKLRQHFDKPFQLVQTKKKIKLPSYAPGMTAFLFSANDARTAWAQKNFASIKRKLTSTEFDMGVRPFLLRAMLRVTVVSLEKDFLPTFWMGVLTIMKQISPEVFGNRMCTMEHNLFKLALEHFQVDSQHFGREVECFEIALDLNGSAFWEAMGEVSAQAVVETVLRSPTLRDLLTITDEKEPLRLEEYFKWCIPFVRSVKPALIMPPVRSLLHVLLGEFQGAPNSRYAQTVTWDKGVSVLNVALDMIAQQDESLLVMNMMEMISKTHLKPILEALDGIEKRDEQRVTESDNLALDALEKSLALDVKNFAHYRIAIQRSLYLDHEIGSAGLSICEASIKAIKPGHAALPAAVLSGLSRILPLEPFTDKQLGAVKTQHASSWNRNLKKYFDLIENKLFERLEAFTPEQLVEVFQETKAAAGLMALLLSGEQRIHQAALSILKILTGEDNRRDCIMHITTAFFSTTVEATAKALHTMGRLKPFTPCQTILKVGADIYGCLCDSQDGILRSDKSLRTTDLAALKALWSRTWHVLELIFAQTEPWSTLGHDKDAMAEFCRATMDFADTVFDQYFVIANRLKDVSRSMGGNNVSKELLGYPRSALANISKWLRLRDEYLIVRAVGLTSKILVRLRDVELTIDADAAEFIEGVVTSTDRHVRVKTKLTMNQKAELQRALEKNLGRPLVDHESAMAKRQTTLAGYTTSGNAAQGLTNDKIKKGVIDLEAWSAVKDRQRADAVDKTHPSETPANEAYKQRMLAQKQKQALVTSKPSAKQQESFLAKRKAEKEAADKAKAAMLAKQKLGAGTGVEGLGDMGKDHTMKGQNVMVSSSEDENDEDDDDDVDDDLFGDANKREKKKKSARPDVDPKGAIGLKPEQRGPTKIRRTARSAKDMRARLAPDLQSLHKTILKWDFFHAGDYPPGVNEHVFRAVNNSYLDPTSYQETFEPLLTLEAWQGIVKNREELERPKVFDVKIQNRSNVDAFIEISSLVSHQENKELSLSEGDLILFSRSAKEPHRDESAPHCLSRIYRIKRQKSHLEIVYQVVSGTTLTFSLTPQAVIHAVKLQSITPLEREYGALQGLQYYDLCQQITKAAPSVKMKFSDRQISTYQDVWNVNRAQSEAINAAMENEGFSLIQGPPGSGKTKTIVAIVGGLLSDTLSSTSSKGGATRITMPHSDNVGRNEDGLAKKLLVCAPSNAAVDELVMRLKEGVKTRNGNTHRIKVVRIGRSEAINQQVMDVTMEQLVNQRLGNNDMDQKMRERNAAIFKEHESVSARLRELYQKRDGKEVKGQELVELEEEIAGVRKRKNELGVKIDNAKDQERNVGREQELNRKKAQQSILDEAHVICATLSGSGHDMFRTLNVEFETVIIDEAAQCVEMSSLIPLKYGCVKCIMVGDPKQLPPTVFSKEAARFQYEQSLFVRMQNNHPNGVYLLDTQYRMHPDISLFPSRTFYDDLLKDGQGMAALRKRPWHKGALLAPYRFFDVQGQHEKSRIGGSLTNKAEVDVAMALFERLTTDFKDYDFAGRIGIITPYKSQLKLLKSTFSSRYGNDIYETIDFNTTDAFQGRESEVIIFSCVRASPAGGIGFLQDIRRMNVGLTRAKSSLWVLGSSESLVRGRYWKKLVEDAKARDKFTTGDVLGMLRKPFSAYPAKHDDDRSMHDRNGTVDQADSKRHEPASTKSETRKDPIKQEKSRSPSVHQPAREGNDRNGDRMEGVTYKFQDRIAKKREASTDIEMRDVSINGASDRDSTGYASGSATPVPESIRKSERKVNTESDTDSVASRNTPSMRSHSSATVRKRPTASPFMPAKKKIQPGAKGR